MSLYYNNNAGVLMPVSGLNGQSGELVVGATTVKTVSQAYTVSAGDVAKYTVTFDTPFSDADYILGYPKHDKSNSHITYQVIDKTANGFSFYVTNPYSSKLSDTVTWTAFKIYKAEDISQAQSDIASIQAKTDVAPTETVVAPFIVIKNGFCANISTRDGITITDVPLTAGAWATNARNVGTLGVSKTRDYIMTPVAYQSGGSWITGAARVYYNGRIDLWSPVALTSYIPYLNATLPLFD